MVGGRVKLSWLAVLASVVALASVGLGDQRVNASPVSLYDSIVDGEWRTVQGSTWLAQSFSTGSSPVSVSSVRAWFRNANESNSGATGTTYSIAIRANTGGVPGALVGSVVSGVSLPAWSENSDTHVPAGAISLSANTTYFVVVTAGAGGTAGWKCNATTVGTDVTPTPTFTALSSSDAGTNWAALSGTCAGKHFSMAVNAATQSTPLLSSFGDVSATLGDSTVTIAEPAASAAGSFAYSSSDSGVASVSGDQLAFVGVGSATITADFTPSDAVAYTTASISMTVTVSAAPPPTTTTTTTTTTAPTTTVPPPTVPVTQTPTTSVATPVASSSTSSTTTTTAASAATTVPPTTQPEAVSTTAPLPQPPSDNPFDNSDREPVEVRIEASVGAVADGTAVVIRSSSLAPEAALMVTVFSEPQVLLQSTADASGRFEAVVELPEGLESGRHTLVVSTSTTNGAIDVAGAFLLDDAGRFTSIVQPTVLTDFAGANDSRLERALEYGRDPYDPRSRPLTTASIVVAATSLLALMGSVGASGLMTGSSSGGSTGTASVEKTAGDDGQRKRKSRGKLAGVVTKKLKGLQIESSARGDISGTWAIAGTAATDSFSRSAPAPLGKWSAMAPRIFVDGAWARAMFGSLGFATWIAGAVVGVSAAFVGTPSPIIPAFGFMVALAVLGILDAGAGAVAWIAIVLSSLLTGHLDGWPEVRTLLGIGLLLSSISLLAHVIRPLRRYVAENSFERWERMLDYLIMPVFVAYAGGSLVKALNGLSGLKVISPEQIVTMRWAVIVAVVVRLAVEDVAAHLYPQRMKQVQPAKLVSPGRAVTSASIVLRTLVFFMIAEPFFGINATTIVAGVLLAVPLVLKMWEDDLPNSKFMHKWLPRGHFRFFVMLVLGAYLSVQLIGDGGPDRLQLSFIPLLLPGVVVGVVELFARSGGNWSSVALKRSLGAVTWTIAAGLTTGVIILFR